MLGSRILEAIILNSSRSDFRLLKTLDNQAFLASDELLLGLTHSPLLAIKSETI
jgi:hypothetical protein